MAADAVLDKKIDLKLTATKGVSSVNMRWKAYGKEVRGLAPGTLNALLSHDWPGNVRELENVVERAVVLCKGA